MYLNVHVYMLTDEYLLNVHVFSKCPIHGAMTVKKSMSRVDYEWWVMPRWG